LVDDFDATVPVPGIPAAATQDSAIAGQQCGPVTCVLQRSWGDLYKAEMPRLVRYLVKCFGDSGTRDAEDAAHNAFVELFTNWDTIRSPRAWLRKVAFRQMLRQNARAEYPLDVLREEPDTVSASERLELREGTQAILRWLRQLPLAQRQVLALIYDEFSYSEIAQIMGISEPAVRKNAERARRKMSELLGSHTRTGFPAVIRDRGNNPPGQPAPAAPMPEDGPARTLAPPRDHATKGSQP
jgi:RNA polymerase sigma factor (sigma-70 family)